MPRPAQVVAAPPGPAAPQDFAPPYARSGPPSHPSNPRTPFGPPQQVFQQPGYPSTPPRATPTAPPAAPPIPPRPVYQNPAVGYGPPRPATPPSGTQYRYPAPAAKVGNSLGTTGLVLGVIGMVLPLLLPFGIIFSGFGLSRARSQTLPDGAAKAGLAVSLIGTFGWIIVMIIISNRA
jgi:hypothetical protein